jgi:hypothetical protein
MSDTPSAAETVSADEIHDRMAPILAAAILLPVTEATGSVADVLALLESVAAAVIAIAANPAEDASVLETFGANVAKKLALLRLDASEPEGSG